MIQEASEGRSQRPQSGFRRSRPFNKNKQRSRGFASRDDRGAKPTGRNSRMSRGGRGGRAARGGPRKPETQEFTGQHKTTATGQHITHVPAGHVWNDNKLRIYCLGGLQEIGR